MKRFAALTSVLLLLAVVTVVSAQEKEAPAADHCNMTAIDSETRVKVQKLKLQYELAMVDLKADKEKIHEEIMAELLKKESSTKTIEKLGKSINSVQDKMYKAKMDYVLKVKKVLPADHYKMFLTKSHGCAPGCTKPCCSTSAGHKGSMGCSHSAGKCPLAGTRGHICTVACKPAGTGCKIPCVKVRK